MNILQFFYSGAAELATPHHENCAIKLVSLFRSEDVSTFRVGTKKNSVEKKKLDSIDTYVRVYGKKSEGYY
jgi:hypothetical protein